MAMPVKIEHRLGIQAPPEAIWAVIVDIPGWSAWNPLYPRAEGVVRIGSQLTLEMKLPGVPPVIRPTVVDWVPNEQILWRLSLAGGLATSIRYLEIEQLAETGCIFSNGELFQGFLGPTIGRRRRGTLRAAFTAMGEAVKARVEATWRPEA
jgi:hypothetical protein